MIIDTIKENVYYIDCNCHFCCRNTKSKSLMVSFVFKNNNWYKNNPHLLSNYFEPVIDLPNLLKNK